MGCLDDYFLRDGNVEDLKEKIEMMWHVSFD